MRVIDKKLKNSDSMFVLLQDDTNGFLLLANILQEQAGIHLIDSPKNRCLLASRLHALMTEKGVSTYQKLASMIKENKSLLSEFVLAMTTNTTHFFREEQHFNIFKKELRNAISYSQGDLKIWCAATSTGQEVYSILISLFETIELESLIMPKIDLLATDIDIEVLEHASKGVYSEKEIESVPPLYRSKYFQIEETGGSKKSRIKKNLRDCVRFRSLNLIGPTYPKENTFDFVFCRNVLIYFSRDTQFSVVRRLLNTVKPKGFLFLGHSEAGAMSGGGVEAVAAAAYRKK